VYENGSPASSSQGITYVGYEDGCQVYELQSGTYRFSTDEADNVQSVSHDAPNNHDIYDLAGRQVNASMLNGLKKGIYIVNERKMLIP